MAPNLTRISFYQTKLKQEQYSCLVEGSPHVQSVSLRRVQWDAQRETEERVSLRLGHRSLHSLTFQSHSLPGSSPLIWLFMRLLAHTTTPLKSLVVYSQSGPKIEQRHETFWLDNNATSRCFVLLRTRLSKITTLDLHLGFTHGQNRDVGFVPLLQLQFLLLFVNLEELTIRGDLLVDGAPASSSTDWVSMRGVALEMGGAFGFLRKLRSIKFHSIPLLSFYLVNVSITIARGGRVGSVTVGEDCLVFHQKGLDLQSLMQTFEEVSETGIGMPEFKATASKALHPANQDWCQVSPEELCEDIRVLAPSVRYSVVPAEARSDSDMWY